MEHPISAFEAKTHLSELLRKAEMGESFLILKRGRPVAHLTPIVEEKTSSFLEILDRLSSLRKKIPGRMDVLKLIQSGRRY